MPLRKDPDLILTNPKDPSWDKVFEYFETDTRTIHVGIETGELINTRRYSQLLVPSPTIYVPLNARETEESHPLNVKHTDYGRIRTSRLVSVLDVADFDCQALDNIIPQYKVEKMYLAWFRKYYPYETPEKIDAMLSRALRMRRRFCQDVWLRFTLKEGFSHSDLPNWYTTEKAYYLNHNLFFTEEFPPKRN